MTIHVFNNGGHLEKKSSGSGCYLEGRLNDFLILPRSLCTLALWKGLVPRVSKLVSFLLGTGMIIFSAISRR